jgi:DNA-binding XRE family transcriptional regulator
MNATPKSERKAPDPTASTAAMPSEAAPVGVAVSMSSRSLGDAGTVTGAEASNGPTPSNAPNASDATESNSQISGSDDASAAGKRQRAAVAAAAAAAAKKNAASRDVPQPNNVRKLRQNAMMSKAELARRAGVSPLTIDRVEAGYPCRMDTKRKILEALGLSPSARAEVWPDID